MNFKDAVKLTQERLAAEDGTMGDLFGYSKKWTTAGLVGVAEWQRLLECANALPITMGAFPFGFEFPLHKQSAEADFGVSLTGGTKTSDIFSERAKQDRTDILANTIVRYMNAMCRQDSNLQDIVGEKLMLEFDVGSAMDGIAELPGFFLRPNRRPIDGGGAQMNDVLTVSNALVSGVGWELAEGDREQLQKIHTSQPTGTRIDSFGVFPSRSRAIRLAVMGFESHDNLGTFLSDIDWTGNISEVLAVTSRFEERAAVVRNGVNLDVQDGSLGSTLGITAMVKQRFTNDPRYWIDDPEVWSPFLNALRQEEIVFSEKLDALSGWVSKPKILFGKSGNFILMRGIHHMKLVVSEGRLAKAKAYVFMVLSATN